MPRPISDDEDREFMDTRQLMSKSARDRWNREQHARAEEILADLQNGRMARILMLEMRENIGDLGDGLKLERCRLELLNTLYNLKEETMYNAAHEPYVPETQTRHAPMTGTHQHDHAAFEDGAHDDGIHGGDGPHTHNGDADHDHSEQHPHSHSFGAGHEPGKDSGSGEAVRVEGMYGRQMSGAIGPAERRRLRDAQLAEHEARRGGSR